MGTLVMLLVGCASDERTVGAPGADGLDCWDQNGDGVADPDEDRNGDGDWTADDCIGDGGGSTDETGAYLGDLHFQTEEAAALFCERHDSIYGDMLVNYAAPDLAALSCLAEVHGDLELHGDVEDHSLPALSYVLGTLTIVTADTFYASADYPAVTELGGLSVGAVSELAAPQLVTIAGDVDLGFPLEELDLGSLDTIEGSFVVESSQLADLDGLSSLRELQGYRVVINAQDLLTDISGLENLELVEGDISVRDNPVLPQAHAEAVIYAIDHVNGSISVSGNGG